MSARGASNAPPSRIATLNVANLVAVHEAAYGPSRPILRRNRMSDIGSVATFAGGCTRRRNCLTWIRCVAGRTRAPSSHFDFKLAINPIRLWRIGFSLIARKPRTRAAPSRVPRNETIEPSGSSPSSGARIFFPALGRPSKK